MKTIWLCGGTVYTTGSEPVGHKVLEVRILSLVPNIMPRALETQQSLLSSVFWVRILVGVPNYGSTGGINAGFFITGYQLKIDHLGNVIN